jgi:hypothetical protein
MLRKQNEKFMAQKKIIFIKEQPEEIPMKKIDYEIASK